MRHPRGPAAGLCKRLCKRACKTGGVDGGLELRVLGRHRAGARRRAARRSAARSPDWRWPCWPRTAARSCRPSACATSCGATTSPPIPPRCCRAICRGCAGSCGRRPRSSPARPGYVLEVARRAGRRRTLRDRCARARALGPTRAQSSSCSSGARAVGADPRSRSSPSSTGRAAKQSGSTSCAPTRTRTCSRRGSRSGAHAALVGELEALVAERPLRERLWRQLIVALYRSGRAAEALRRAEAFRTLLREELGLEPSPAFRELEARVLDRRPDAVARRTRRRAASTAATPAGRDHPARRPRRRARASSCGARAARPAGDADRPGRRRQDAPRDAARERAVGRARRRGLRRRARAGARSGVDGRRDRDRGRRAAAPAPLGRGDARRVPARPAGAARARQLRAPARHGRLAVPSDSSAGAPR